MALPTDLLGLDHERYGQVSLGWTAPSLSPSRTLDNEVWGTIFFLQDEQIVLAAALITFIVESVKARASYRDYPNKPFELEQESQIKQVVPYPPAQYPLT